eukprot:maker-scaffold747_size103044-snap-gene-0.18 protein:Tk12104 transcript:maker-scaffold747_size103044-snap-gene-0.18-mRNA-1 annotation:"transcriptional regulator"
MSRRPNKDWWSDFSTVMVRSGSSSAGFLWRPLSVGLVGKFHMIHIQLAENHILAYIWPNSPTILELIKEVVEDGMDKDGEEEGNTSDISGYHSDSESCVMTSGNSPFISKEARYNFLSRS